MDQFRQGDEIANAQVIGAAGLASGVVGGVVAALMHRSAVRKEEAAATQAAEAAAAAAASASPSVSALLESVRSSTNESVSRVLSQAPQSREEWAAAAQKVRAQATTVAKDGQERSKQRLNEVDIEAISKQARKAFASSQLNSRADQLRKNAPSLALPGRKGSKQGIGVRAVQGLTNKRKRSSPGISSGLAAAATALATAAGQQSQGVTSTVKQQSTQAKVRAGLAVVDAKARGGHVVGQAKERAPELRVAFGQSIVPVVKDLQNRAPELRKSVERSIVPKVREVQDRAVPLLGSATGALASTLETGKGLASGTRNITDRDLVPVLKERAGTAAKSLGQVASQASGGLSGVSATVDERSRHAAHAAAHGTKDTGALAAWSIAAGSLIFYGFMDDEQREKAKAAGNRIVQEAREIYRDIQGEE